MPPIDAEIVIFFQFGWIVVICLLLRQIFKLKDVIIELKGTLAPFAKLYETGEYRSGDVFPYHIFKRAYEVYTENR